MLHRSLITSEDAKATVPKVVSFSNRRAPYTIGGSLGWIHHSKEMNYRKKPLRWRAYSAKECDVFAPFQIISPLRHASRGTVQGMWFGAGHIAIYPKFGLLFQLRNSARFSFFWIGAAIPWLQWYHRNYMAGWEVRNKGAIYGMD